jgi:hypothetical protein
MAEESEKKITIDGVEYALENLSEGANAQLESIKFVDIRLQQLNNEWAVSDTARIGYATALKSELEKIKSDEK